MREFNKLFCIGLTRTGTSSLTEALNILGIPCRHYPKELCTIEQLLVGQWDLPILEKYRALSDLPVATYYPQLDKMYPDSLFIYTNRDKHEWMASVKDELKGQDPDDRKLSYEGHLSRSRLIRLACYGTRVWDEDRFSYAYDRHHREVNHFGYGSDILLCMNITKGDGWDSLCRFLEVDKPDVPFPHLKKFGKDRRAYWEKKHGL